MADDTKPEEQQYTCPETGKPIIYADNVPELLRGDLTLSPMRQRYAKKLNEMTHVERASRGSQAWNFWVRAYSREWLYPKDLGNLIFVRLACCSADLFSSSREIDLCLGVSKNSDDKSIIPVFDFKNFMFPTHVCARNSIFNELVELSNAKFQGYLFVDQCIFRQGLIADDTEFNGEVCFTQCSFDSFVCFENTSFMDRLFFDESKFGREFWIHNSEVCKSAFFIEAQFRQRVEIVNSHFFSRALFSQARFGASSTFQGSSFYGGGDFSYCQFEEYANFDDVVFTHAYNIPEKKNHNNWNELSLESHSGTSKEGRRTIVPNFVGAKFGQAPDLGRITVRYAAHGLAWYEKLFADDGVDNRSPNVNDSSAAAKFRSLAELAARGHHHIAEKRFFRAELLCRRGHEARGRETLMINLFELFSMCGLSFRRPVMWWLGLFAVFFAVYGGFAGLFEAGWSLEDTFHLINYTFSNATPVLGVIKASDSAAVQALFTGGQPPWVTLLAGVHNLISTIFLFFALLAIRNYFKLG